MSICSLKIPLEMCVPKEIVCFTEEENAIMLNVGSRAVLFIQEEAKKVQQTQSTQKIIQEFMEGYLSKENEGIKKKYDEMVNTCKEKDILIRNFELQRETIKKTLDFEYELLKTKENLERLRLEGEKENDLEKTTLELLNKIKLLEEKIFNMEKQNDLEIKNTQQYKQRYDELHEKYSSKLMEEMDLENKMLKETNEETVKNMNNLIEEYKKMQVLANTSLSFRLGKRGENDLEQLLIEAFGGYEDFELENTSGKGHLGDFHLKFNNFNILADSKNFMASGVKKTDIDKLKRDMQSNSNIKIAWLVSLGQPINNYNLPITVEVIDGVCYCFINLRDVENPKDMLKMVWNICDLYVKFTSQEDNCAVIENYKSKDVRNRKNIENIVKILKEQKFTITKLKQSCESMEQTIMLMINDDKNIMIEKQTKILQDWWIVKARLKEGNKIKIKKIHTKFIKETNNNNDDFDIQTLKMLIPQILEDKYLDYGTGNVQGVMNILGF